MDASRIACKLNNMKMDRYEAMELVAEWGIGGVHLSANGPFAPEELDGKARKDLVKHVEGLGMQISAIMLWGGGVDLCEAEDWEKNVQWGESLLELAADLGCGIWGAHVGIIPWEPEGERWDNMVHAMVRLGKRGDEVGACVAIETGPEPPFVLKKLIETVGSERIRANYDPANLVIWPALLAERAGEEYDRDQALSDFEPSDGPRVIGEYVVHTHAKDALVGEDGKWQEVPLGTGWVDWPRYVANLEAAGFDGYFAIERETGDDPIGDIKRAVDFLKTL